MRYIPINENLSIVEQEVKVKKVVEKKEPVNFVWIYDRSGSMTWLLPDLCQQLIKLTRKIQKGNTLSLGWFSGEGDFNWVFKGFKITENADYKSIEQAIKQNSSSRNTTCFSEVLEDTADNVIKDLSIFSKTFSLNFFTDGYPVVNNYQKEISDIYSAINKIKGRVTSASLIGFGVYYNKDLMSSMAEKLGAMLIHSSEISEYTNHLTKLISLSEVSDPKEEVDSVVSKPLAVYTITDQGIVIYTPDENGKLLISPNKGQTTLYYVSEEKPNKKSWDKVEVSSIDFGSSSDRIAKALYAGALVLTQQTKTDKALEIMGKVGDKKAIDAMNNAFTIEEYGKAEDLLNMCIQDVSLRFSTGRDPNYLPDEGAYCMFNLLQDLMNDEDAAFFPYHEKFQYEKIGVSSKTKDGFPEFKADKTSKCPLSTFTWHESRLNLSVQTSIQGTIGLVGVNGKKASDVGLPDTYKTFIYRNYAFIKDGRIHIKKFYVSTSEETYRKLKNQGLVFDDTFKTNGTYGVDTSNLTAVNRKIATGKTSAKALCDLAIEEQKLKGRVKALKFLKTEIYGDEKYDKPASLTDEQIAFLKANGVRADKDRSFDPPRELGEARDKYMAKAFDIKIAGLSSLPSVKEVREKVASKKNLTISQKLVEEGINEYNSVKASFNNGKDGLKWLESTIKDLQRKTRGIRSYLQESKFAVILGRKWFEEFQGNRENCVLEQDGVKYTFALSEEAVEI